MTLDDIKLYLRIDSNEENDLLNELISVSQIYIDSCVGENYKTYENAVKLANLLQKKIINDLYENRSANLTNAVKQDLIVTTILEKLSNYEAIV